MMSSERYGRSAAPCTTSITALPTSPSSHATTRAAGNPLATSPASVGPDSATALVSTKISSSTCESSFKLPSSMPLAQRTRMGERSPMQDASAIAVLRMCCAGAARKMASAVATSAISPVARMDGARVMPGRKTSFSHLRLMLSTTSASRAQRTTCRPCDAIALARALPHAPAPMIATESIVVSFM